MEKNICEHCGEEFKAEIDLEAHKFNNKHCSEKVKCPECLSPVSQDELNMFGGMCENCTVEE